MMHRLLCVASVAALGLSACAPVTTATDDTPSARPADPCFYASQVRSFRTDRSDRLYVRAVRDDVYRLDALGGCPDLDGAVALSLVPRFGGTDRLCEGDRVRVVISQPSPTFAAPCEARVVGVLTPEDLEALPPRVRP